MKRILPLAILAVAVLAACNEQRATAPIRYLSIGDALLSTTAGFSTVNSSYNSSADSGHGWGPEGPRMGGLGHGGPGMGGLMGGGLGPDFDGGRGMGFGREHGGEMGPFAGFALPSTCTFSSTTGRVSCPAETNTGLTITRSAAFTDASGAAQPAFDPLTTNAVNVTIDAMGTIVHRSDTSVVSNSSDRTVSGLAAGSTQRTVNGTSRGTELTHGTNPTNGAFTASRAMSDTTTGLVVPMASGRPTYPSAGTVIRNMSVTLTLSGQTPTTTTRREVITYNGTAGATIVITENGTTKTCTLALPQGRPSCP